MTFSWLFNPIVLSQLVEYMLIDCLSIWRINMSSVCKVWNYWADEYIHNEDVVRVIYRTHNIISQLIHTPWQTILVYWIRKPICLSMASIFGWSKFNLKWLWGTRIGFRREALYLKADVHHQTSTSIAISIS